MLVQTLYGLISSHCISVLLCCYHYHYKCKMPIRYYWFELLYKMVQYTEMFSENHNVLHVIDRFKFSVNKRWRGGQQRFKCTNNTNKCYATFHTDASTVIDKMHGYEHKCDTPEEYVWQEGNNALIRKDVKWMWNLAKLFVEHWWRTGSCHRGSRGK